MLAYTLLKNTHVGLAVVSIAGFVVRGYWMMRGSGLLGHQVTRVAPHIVDTVFLLTGIALVYELSLPVFANTWLIAKFAGLIAYIVLGAIALRRGPTLQVRLVAFVGALSAFAYIVGAAVAKSPASWLAWFAA